MISKMMESGANTGMKTERSPERETEMAITRKSKYSQIYTLCMPENLMIRGRTAPCESRQNMAIAFSGACGVSQTSLHRRISAEFSSTQNPWTLNPTVFDVPTLFCFGRLKASWPASWCSLKLQLLHSKPGKPNPVLCTLRAADCFFAACESMMAFWRT